MVLHVLPPADKLRASVVILSAAGQSPAGIAAGIKGLKVITQVYSNATESAEVIMDGMSCGCHRLGGTVVRKTTDGKFAVIKDRGTRLIKVFGDRLQARRYNFAIHGDNLGE